jgi:hypothetical protein
VRGLGEEQVGVALGLAPDRLRLAAAGTVEPAAAAKPCSAPSSPPWLPDPKLTTPKPDKSHIELGQNWPEPNGAASGPRSRIVR